MTPGSSRLQKQKLEEAVARGDLLVNDKSRKRKRADDGDQQQRQSDFGRGRGRGRGRGQGTFSDRGRPGSTRGGAHSATPLPPKPIAAKFEAKEESAAVTPSKSAQHASQNNPPLTKASKEVEATPSDSDEDSSMDSNASDSDVDPVLDAVSSKQPTDMVPVEDEPSDDDDGADGAYEVKDTAAAAATQGVAVNSRSTPHQQQKRPRQPRPPPQNPFAQRPSLLHSVRRALTDMLFPGGTVAD